MNILRCSILLLISHTAFASPPSFSFQPSDKTLSQTLSRWAQEHNRTILWDSYKDWPLHEHHVWNQWSNVEQASSLDDALHKTARIIHSMDLRRARSHTTKDNNDQTKPTMFVICDGTKFGYTIMIRTNNIACDKESPRQKRGDTRTSILEDTK